MFIYTVSDSYVINRELDDWLERWRRKLELMKQALRDLAHLHDLQPAKPNQPRCPAYWRGSDRRWG